MAGTSRMSREAHVRICGGLEVKFLRSTRPANSRRGINRRKAMICAFFPRQVGKEFLPVELPVLNQPIRIQRARRVPEPGCSQEAL